LVGLDHEGCITDQSGAAAETLPRGVCLQSKGYADGQPMSRSVLARQPEEPRPQGEDQLLDISVFGSFN